MQTAAPRGGGLPPTSRPAREEQLAARRPAVEVGRRAVAADPQRRTTADRDEVVLPRPSVAAARRGVQPAARSALSLRAAGTPASAAATVRASSQLAALTSTSVASPAFSQRVYCDWAAALPGAASSGDEGEQRRLDGGVHARRDAVRRRSPERRCGAAAVSPANVASSSRASTDPGRPITTSCDRRGRRRPTAGRPRCCSGARRAEGDSGWRGPRAAAAGPWRARCRPAAPAAPRRARRR